MHRWSSLIESYSVVCFRIFNLITHTLKETGNDSANLLRETKLNNGLKQSVCSCGLSWSSLSRLPQIRKWSAKNSSRSGKSQEKLIFWRIVRKNWNKLTRLEETFEVYVVSAIWGGKICCKLINPVKRLSCVCAWCVYKTVFWVEQHVNMGIRPKKTARC